MRDTKTVSGHGWLDLKFDKPREIGTPHGNVVLPPPPDGVGYFGEHSRAFWEALDITLDAVYPTLDEGEGEQ